MSEIDYRPLGPEDAGEALTVQRAAFVVEARLYGTTEIPPLAETLEELRREIQSTLTIGAFRGTRLVGVIRLTLEGSIGWISRIAVAPDQQGLGIGSGLLDVVERSAPKEVERFQLAAGAQSEANISLYERRGYHAFSRMIDPAGIQMTLMRKQRDPRVEPE